MSTMVGYALYSVRNSDVWYRKPHMHPMNTTTFMSLRNKLRVDAITGKPEKGICFISYQSFLNALHLLQMFSDFRIGKLAETSGSVLPLTFSCTPNACREKNKLKGSETNGNPLTQWRKKISETSYHDFRRSSNVEVELEAGVITDRAGLVELKVVACSLSAGHHFGGGIEPETFGSRVKHLNHLTKGIPTVQRWYWLIYIKKRQDEIAERRRQDEIQIAEQKRQDEIAERRRQDEIQIAEQKKQDEIAERRRQDEIAERKRKDEMQFELQKIRLEAEGRSLNSNSLANQNVNSMQIKPKLEIHHLMQTFNSDENDISLYLIMFERLAKQAEILENTWVTHLLDSLPYDVAQLTAREPDEIANDYGEVEKILLKRYKLTPEKFRQKFFMHNKNLGSTWKNFAYELKSFFNEWVNGIKADSFEKLSDLIITDQIKRKVSQEIKDHFIDEWSKLNSPDDLVEKLDDYDTLRSTFMSKQPRKECHYDKQNSFKDDSVFTTNEKRKLYGIRHNERGEPKCFHCSNFGHIARNCSMPKSVLTCREGNETGLKIINCVAKETNHASEESLSVRLVGENSDDSNSFLKKSKINNCDNVQALIDTGSSCCLLKISVAQKLKLKFERAANKIYGFGNQKMPALTPIGRIKADIEVDGVKAENISIYVVPDDAQSVDLIIGRTWLGLPHIAYTKIGKRVHIGYREDELFRNFPIDEKVNPVCLERLETAQLQFAD
ncbi:hypothetical protein AVEN_75998-1 [Araneus ventricosus]|uniref:CCHC-type domain-containing protein n=1 Tax=Araneus ventricosus TaxID=182803 RepID=A0A4Y2FFQ3_ARAVE|nr:hypothetical protein AVEN_75998-1 [Araneus ventricosus]